MSETVIGVLHPGEMGAAVAGCLTGRGFKVGCGRRRAQPGHGRAGRGGRADRRRTVSELAARADFILSICPPHAALATARAVAGSPGGFPGIFVDANAISPGTARQVRAVVEQAGASYVDGGIIGLPRPAGRGHPALPVRPAGGPGRGPVRRHRAGRQGDRCAAGQRGGVGGQDGLRGVDQGQRRAAAGRARRWPGRKASRTSCCRVGAVPAGAGPPVGRGGQSAAAKGWRWTGEMEEIAASMAAAGLPGGFHQAAAEIFRRPGRSSSATGSNENLHAVLTALLSGDTTLGE